MHHCYAGRQHLVSVLSQAAVMEAGADIINMSYGEVRCWLFMCAVWFGTSLLDHWPGPMARA
jgi:hypothetical protein